MKRLRGAVELAHEAVDATLELVDLGHESASRAVRRVAAAVPALSEPVAAVDELRRLHTRGVLGAIRFANRVAARATKAALDLAEEAGRSRGPGGEPGGERPRDAALPLRSDVAPSAGWVADAALGLVNAAVGDHLHARTSGLDLGFSLRRGDAYLDLTPDGVARAVPAATERVVVFVHGLATTEWSWCLGARDYWGDAGECFGTRLERELGVTSVFARYNTGRHISENGRLLAGALQALVGAWPVPVRELTLVGHSMGGLVSRSACSLAAAEPSAHATWAPLVSRVICLGSPHHGAPLEKAGNLLTAALEAVDLPGTRVPGRILRARSAGIKDLRFGSVVDADWLGHDPDALLRDTRTGSAALPWATYLFVASTITRDPEHPLGQLVGDLLVRAPSAGGHGLEHRAFGIDTARFGGVMHHELQNHPDVYEVVRAACAGDPQTG